MGYVDSVECGDIITVTLSVHHSEFKEGRINIQRFGPINLQPCIVSVTMNNWVSLSELHTSELSNAINIIVYICRMYSVCPFRLQFNGTACCMRSVSNIFTLQTTFQNEQSVHSFPMSEDGEERWL